MDQPLRLLQIRFQIVLMTIIILTGLFVFRYLMIIGIHN